MPDTESRSDVTALTVQLLSAYLANNTVASDDLANLIRTTRSALTEDVKPAPAEPVEEKIYKPAVTPRKSLASPEHILSLVDGKPYKTLKRHLARHGLTPDSYRERYNLPSSYPMVAPSFAANRREIAERIGLGVRSKPRPETTEQQNHAAAGNDESGAAKTSLKSAAKAEKQKAASTARSRPKAAMDKTAPATSSKPQAANDKPVVAKAAAAPKKTAAVAEKDTKSTAKVKPGTSPSPKVQTPRRDKAKPKRDAVATSRQTTAGATKRPARKKPTDATNTPVIGEPRAKAEPAAAAQARPARGAKLSLFRTEAGKTDGGDAVIPDAAPATPSEAGPARKTPKIKRMARMPPANSPQ